MGRRRPYTERGLRRRPCVRCGAPSEHQWKVRSCAAGGPEEYRGLCTPCDLDLNRLVLEFFRVEDIDAVLAAYRREADEGSSS